MKQLFTILFLFITVCSTAQPKKHITVLSNTRLLEQSLFEERDSLTIENLFAKSISFSQGGKTLLREEAIRKILNNKAVYTRLIDDLPGYGVDEINDSLIVKHFYKADEKKEDGTQSVVRFSVEAVWAKEKKKWKLFRCQLIKL